MEFLDKTGVQTLWNKCKNTFEPKKGTSLPLEITLQNGTKLNDERVKQDLLDGLNLEPIFPGQHSDSDEFTYQEWEDYNQWRITITEINEEEEWFSFRIDTKHSVPGGAALVFCPNNNETYIGQWIGIGSSYSNSEGYMMSMYIERWPYDYDESTALAAAWSGDWKIAYFI